MGNIENSVISVAEARELTKRALEEEWAEVEKAISFEKIDQKIRSSAEEGASKVSFRVRLTGYKLVPPKMVVDYLFEMEEEFNSIGYKANVEKEREYAWFTIDWYERVKANGASNDVIVEVEKPIAGDEDETSGV